MSKQDQPNTEAGLNHSISPELRKRLAELHEPFKRIVKMNEPLMEISKRQQNLIDFANEMAATHRLADDLVYKENFGSNLNHIQAKPSPSLSLTDFIASERKAQQRLIDQQAKANAEAFKTVIDEVLTDHSRDTNKFQEGLSKKTVLWTVILTAIVTSFLTELYKDQRSSFYETQTIEQSVTNRDVRQYEDF